MAHTQHHDAVGQTTADDQYLETPPGAAYEHTDASVWIIVKFLAWLIVAAVVIHIGLGMLFNLYVEQRTARGEPEYPLAVREGTPLPPEPRLQQFPREELMKFRMGEETVLQNYGWVDRGAGTVRIPINDAMRLLLERKTLASTPPEPGAPAAAAPDMTPSDASAGRVLQRRRQ